MYQQERAVSRRLVWNVTGVNNDLTVTRGEHGHRTKSPTTNDAQITRRGTTRTLPISAWRHPMYRTRCSKGSHAHGLVPS